jgi:hypothetical protein
MARQLHAEEREGGGRDNSYAWRHGGGGVAALVRLLLAVMDLTGDFDGSSNNGGGSGK